MTDVQALTVEEYKSCKQQILEDIKWMDHLEIYSFGAVAAVFVFIFSQTDPFLVKVSSLMPVAISIVGAMRTLALDKTIGVLNDYLQTIEANYPNIGFTNYYRARRSAVMKASRYMVWCVLPLLTLGFALFVWLGGPFWVKGAHPCQ